MTTPNTAPPDPVRRSLPRRANGIRALAVALALRKTTELALRQTVSDRISYGLAIVLGAVIYDRLGRWGIIAVAAIYCLASAAAWRKYRTVKRLNEEHPT